MPADLSRVSDEVKGYFLDCYRDIPAAYALGMQALERGDLKAARQAFNSARITSHFLEWLNTKYVALRRDDAEEAAQLPAITSGPLPVQYEPLVEFCMSRFTIPSDLRPTIKMVSDIREPAIERTREPGYRIDGQYIRALNEIRIRDGLSEAETERVIIHEFAHAYEQKVGFMTDEVFAKNMELELHGEWIAQERDRRVRTRVAREMGWGRR